MQEFMEEALRLAREGVPEEDFLRMKRSALGRRIRGLDGFESTCFRLCAYYLSGFDYFRFPAVYQEITSADVLAFLKTSVTKDRMSLAVIYPNNQEDTQ